MPMLAWIEQMAKISDIEETIEISRLPMFLTDDDPKIRERAETRLKELQYDQEQSTRGTFHCKGTN